MSLPEARCLERSADTVRLEILADPTLVQFQGHFPGKPILPGVAQVDWALRLAARYFELPGTCQALEKLKFQGLVQPGEVLELALEWNAARRSLSFAFSCAGQAKSSGKAVFAA